MMPSPSQHTAFVLVAISFLMLLHVSACTGGKNAALWEPAMPDSVAARAPSIEAQKIASSIHIETNSARTERGLDSLAWSSDIARIAITHSQDMAQQGYFGHINTRGESATERAARLGYTSLHRTSQYVIVGIGENLFATHRYSEYSVHHMPDEPIFYVVTWKDSGQIAREAVDAWLQSPSHRRNVLSTAYTTQGIGVAIAANGTIFVTQNFN